MPHYYVSVECRDEETAVALRMTLLGMRLDGVTNLRCVNPFAHAPSAPKTLVAFEFDWTTSAAMDIMRVLGEFPTIRKVTFTNY